MPVLTRPTPVVDGRWQPPRIVTIGSGRLPTGLREAVADDSVSLAVQQLDVIGRLPTPHAVLVVPGLEDPPAASVVRAVDHRVEAPIVAVLDGSTERERISVLHAGADDCVGADIGVGELLARLEVLSRRALGGHTCEAGGVRLDHLTRQAWVGSRPLELTRREFDLLAKLVGAPRRVFSREQLLLEVWGAPHEAADTSTVTEHVRRLRSKLRASGGSRDCIRTLRGVGYRFEPEGCPTTCRSDEPR